MLDKLSWAYNLQVRRLPCKYVSEETQIIDNPFVISPGRDMFLARQDLFLPSVLRAFYQGNASRYIRIKHRVNHAKNERYISVKNKIQILVQTNILRRFS